MSLAEFTEARQFDFIGACGLGHRLLAGHFAHLPPFGARQRGLSGVVLYSLTLTLTLVRFNLHVCVCVTV